MWKYTSSISCPSQLCATLSQYLLDNNGTLPVVSHWKTSGHIKDGDVERRMGNVAFSGSPLSLTMLSCHSTVNFISILISFLQNYNKRFSISSMLVQYEMNILSPPF